MQIKCVAIDDEPLALELVVNYINQFPFLKLLNSFDDAIAGSEFLRSHPVDLLFVDVDMPDINGIDLVKSLKPSPLVIFTTAHKKFAADGYDLDAADYLVKPIRLERFEKAVNKAKDQFTFRNAEKSSVDQSLFVRSEYQLVKIDLQDIEYIESMEDYCRIHVSNARPVMTLMTLKALFEKLPADKFLRIHRSYVVPRNKIRSVVNRKVKLTGVELPVGESYATMLNQWMKK